MEKLLHLLRDQLQVRGILQGLKDAGSSPEPHYESVGDVLRRGPEPPLIIEFFDESPGAAEIRRQLSPTFSTGAGRRQSLGLGGRKKRIGSMREG
jgi:hypothetical protein